MFYDESDVHGSGGREGGINFEGVTFQSNYALKQLCKAGTQAGVGGAIFFQGVRKPEALLKNVRFFRNVAQGESTSTVLLAVAGAMGISLGTNITCTNCVFSSNVALYGLGNDIMSFSSDELKLNYAFFANCTFSNLTDDTLKNVIDATATLTLQLCTKVSEITRIINGLNVSRRLESQDTLEERHLKYVQPKDELLFPFMRVPSALSGAEFSTRRNLASKPIPNFNFSGIASLVNFFPSIVMANGYSIFIRPNFNGQYHIFLGNTNSFGVKSSNLISYSRRAVSTIYGNIQTNLIVTIVEADLFLVAAVKKMTIGRLNAFNATLFISSNVIVSSSSVLYNASILGSGSTNYSSYRHHKKLTNFTISSVIYPTIRFKGAVLAGLSLQNIASSFGSGSVFTAATSKSSEAGNTTYVSRLTLDSCIMFISSEFLISASAYAPRYDTPLSLFLTTTVLVILRNKAIVNITAGASMSIFANTLFYAINSTSSGIVNAGDD